MNGHGSRKALKTSFRASPRSIRPLYTGGPVLLTKDGKWLVSTMGEEVMVTEVSTGLSVARVRGDSTAITSLALSYHTSPPTLITCHLSTQLRYYPLPDDLPAGSETPTLTYSRQTPKHKRPHPRLHRLARQHPPGNGTDGRVRIFDLRDANSRVVGGGGAAKAKAVLEGHASVVRGIDVSDDGRWAITGGDKVVLVWDLAAEGKKGKGKAGPRWCKRSSRKSRWSLWGFFRS
ncbi:U3 small nucleolar RNA-associated protein 13, partial [Saitozyma podzolica]